MSDLEVRRFELTDFEDVMAILCQSWGNPEVVGPNILRRIQANPEFQYVAERQGDVVGFMTSYGISFKERTGSVGYFATDIEHRRTGVARAAPVHGCRGGPPGSCAGGS